MNYLAGLLILVFLSSCSSGEENQYTQEFLLDPEYNIEILAHEPLLKAPVAIDFDLQGRIWVVEMTGYMRDIDGSDEELADGRISILVDHDRDGIFEDKKVFLDGLQLPRALKLYNGGLLYAEPPNLWWVKIVKDEPGEKVLVDSMYANGGNVEHMPNGLLYNLDNWIYSAKSDRRYQFRNGIWHVESTLQRGQWGITNDANGRLFYNDNSNPLFGDLVLPNSFDGNPYLKKEFTEHLTIPDTARVYPLQATSINRGYIPGVLDEEGKLINMTSACSPLVFKSLSLGDENYGNAFVCAPEVNLIKRYELVYKGDNITAKSNDTIREFLVSKEETFRPVNLNEGPNGAMYIVDMRKAIIQHRAYMTTYLREKLIAAGLDQYEDGGRIYRLSKGANQYQKRNYEKDSLKDWVNKLGSDIYWERIKAQEILVVANDKSLLPDIKTLLMNHSSPSGQIHALWTLAGMEILDGKDISDLILSTEDKDLMSTLVSLLPEYASNLDEQILLAIIQKLSNFNNGEVDLSLSNALGRLESEDSLKKWLNLAIQYKNIPAYEEALVSGINGHEESYLELLEKEGFETNLNDLLLTSIKNRNNKEIQITEMTTEDLTDERTRGLFLYHQYCGTCHGKDGKGMANIAPPIYESPFANGPSEHLVLIALNGMRGPLVMDGVTYNFNAEMPGLKDNPTLTDEDIRDILLFVRNSFSSSHERISTGMVTRLRKATKDRKELFTQEELKQWILPNQPTKPKVGYR
jgi:mono/diheme cytochrome c family protein